MRLKIKRKNMTRVASLSALGAGAMVLTTGTANASIVHVVVDETIVGPFGSGFFEPSLPGGLGFALTARPFSYHAIGTVRQGGNSMSFSAWRGTKVSLRAVRSITQSGNERPTTIDVGSHHVHSFTLRRFPTGTIIYQKFLSSVAHAEFRSVLPFLQFFSDNGTPHYGWGQLRESVSGPGPLEQTLEVTFIDYAYDTTGAFLPAGVTGAPVPEPAETIPLGLSVLVLGAGGRSALASIESRVSCDSPAVAGMLPTGKIIDPLLARGEMPALASIVAGGRA